MSWQEELRRLDAELAAGRLGHAEHRRQRDELLAEASGGGAASPVASPLRQDAPSNGGSPTWSSPAASAPQDVAAIAEPGSGDAAATQRVGSDRTGSAQSGGAATSAAANPAGSATSPAAASAAGEATSTTSEAASSTTSSAASSAASPAASATTNPAAPSTPSQAAPATPAPPATSSAPPFFAQQPSPATPPPNPNPAAPHQPQQQMPAQPGTWPGVAPVQWNTPGQQQQQQPVVGWASTNPAMPAPEPPAVESFLNSGATVPSAEKTQPAFSHTPGTPFSTDRPTTAPSPADDRPTAVFGAVPANGGQPEPRRLWEDDAKPRGSKPTWLFLSLAVLVVLALVVGVIWFIGNKDDTSGTASPPPASSTPNTQPPSLEDKLPTLPGTASPENSTMALDKAVQAKAVSDADANLMRAAGADQLVYHAYAAPEGGTTLIAVPTPSKAQAGQLVQGLRQNLVTGGFDSSPLGPAATDLLYGASSPAGRVLAFWYTSGGVSIGIGVSGPVGQDPAALRSRMEEIRAKVAAALPAS
ncbi:hypothetical protein [Amycolatopsis sp. WGS_07]|uniref:hypothetical protein n=1 Tax=Amycolatopsis sp. WGS_07 TaxID=3076764 RepID=UPI003872C181